MDKKKIDEKQHDKSRRDFLKKTVYTAPVILSLNAVPARAGYGSGLQKPSGPHKPSKEWGPVSKKKAAKKKVARKKVAAR